jgi:hypothetical protein
MTAARNSTYLITTHFFFTKHPRTHNAPSHPKFTQTPTMRLAACSHQQQVEREIVASVFVVSCACIGCACFFLWFLDIVDLGCVACVFLWLLPVTGSVGYCSVGYQSQVQRDIVASVCACALLSQIQDIIAKYEEHLATCDLWIL